MSSPETEHLQLSSTEVESFTKELEILAAILPNLIDLVQDKNPINSTLRNIRITNLKNEYPKLEQSFLTKCLYYKNNRYIPEYCINTVRAYILWNEYTDYPMFNNLSSEINFLSQFEGYIESMFEVPRVEIALSFPKFPNRFSTLVDYLVTETQLDIEIQQRIRSVESYQTVQDLLLFQQYCAPLRRMLSRLSDDGLLSVNEKYSLSETHTLALTA
jgi:hypothetical protein